MVTKGQSSGSQWGWAYSAYWLWRGSPKPALCWTCRIKHTRMYRNENRLNWGYLKTVDFICVKSWSQYPVVLQNITVAEITIWKVLNISIISYKCVWRYNYLNYIFNWKNKKQLVTFSWNLTVIPEPMFPITCLHRHVIWDIALLSGFMQSHWFTLCVNLNVTVYVHGYIGVCICIFISSG